MSYADQRQWEEDLRIAGWRQVGGLWTHSAVGGLHNLKSAINELKKAIS